jgi:hypothetical protein
VCLNPNIGLTAGGPTGGSGREVPFCAARVVVTVVVLARRSVLGRMREIAESCGTDVSCNSQSVRFPPKVLCAGEARPATLLLARVAYARNGTSATRPDGYARMKWDVMTRPLQS